MEAFYYSQDYGEAIVVAVLPIKKSTEILTLGATEEAEINEEFQLFQNKTLPIFQLYIIILSQIVSGTYKKKPQFRQILNADV
jgi:hypothetical protein